MIHFWNHHHRNHSPTNWYWVRKPKVRNQLRTFFLHVPMWFTQSFYMLCGIIWENGKMWIKLFAWWFWWLYVSHMIHTKFLIHLCFSDGFPRTKMPPPPGRWQRRRWARTSPERKRRCSGPLGGQGGRRRTMGGIKGIKREGYSTTIY